LSKTDKKRSKARKNKSSDEICVDFQITTICGGKVGGELCASNQAGIDLGLSFARVIGAILCWNFWGLSI